MTVKTANAKAQLIAETTKLKTEMKQIAIATAD